MMSRNVFFKMKHCCMLLLFACYVVRGDVVSSTAGSALDSEIADQNTLNAMTRISSVNTIGLSCIDEYNVPCIYASNINSMLKLTIDNVYRHRLSVAVTSEKPSPSIERDRHGIPLCSRHLMLDRIQHLETEVREGPIDIIMPFYLPNSTQGMSQKDYYFCLNTSSHNSSWIHQGEIKVKVKSMSVTGAYVPAAVMTGILPTGDRTWVDPLGHVNIPADVDVTLRLFGFNFSVATSVRFTTHKATRWDRCDDLKSSKGFIVHSKGLTDHSAEITVNLPEMNNADEKLYMCVKESDRHGEIVRWIHQGSEAWMLLQTEGRILPLWLQIIIILTLLTLSGLFSGLNLGLMALDRTDLKIIENTGSEEEKKYAKIISPVRKLGNYLLCTLLLGNVLVNSSLTILLDDLTSGLIAVVGSTLAIVIFGEIVPQAICSRHGLFIGAHTVWVTKFFMLVTFPLSFPISKMLDLILGDEIGNFYNRERLKELIRVTNEYHDLQKDEINIISGALELSKKTVADVMTKLDDVFMIPYDANLDFETMSDIMKQGYTRIPIFEKDVRNVVALLNIKDLAFVDPDDKTPVKTLCQFYNHPISYFFEDTTLAEILNEFKKGQSHMAFVRRINNEGEGDPFYEIVGVVTLEDVIEEIIQSEINDETDVVSDNRRRLKRKEAQLKQDFSSFAQQGENHVQISPQMTLAAFQYLSTALDQFKPGLISPTVLKRLLKQDIYVQIKSKQKESPTVIYECGKPVDYFVLILEGKMQVTIGKECLVFECGPFTYFGTQALVQLSGDGSATPVLGYQIPTSASAPSSIPSINSPSPQQLQSQPPSQQQPPPSQQQQQSAVNSSTISGLDQGNSSKYFIPDYSVQSCHDVMYIRIKRSLYQATLKATMMERQNRLDPNMEDPFKNIDQLHSDSMERLNGPFHRNSPNSPRSSSRSVIDNPEPWNTSLRSVSTACATSPFKTNNQANINRNRAFSQPEVVSRMRAVPEVIHDRLEIQKPRSLTYTTPASNRLSYPKQDSNGSRSEVDSEDDPAEYTVVDVPPPQADDEDSAGGKCTTLMSDSSSSPIQNGDVTFSRFIESNL